MAAVTIQERVLAELRRSSRPLDDDELARRLNVSPRQAINQACHKRKGPEGCTGAPARQARSSMTWDLPLAA